MTVHTGVTPGGWGSDPSSGPVPDSCLLWAGNSTEQYTRQSTKLYRRILWHHLCPALFPDLPRAPLCPLLPRPTILLFFLAQPPYRLNIRLYRLARLPRPLTPLHSRRNWCCSTTYRRGDIHQSKPARRATRRRRARLYTSDIRLQGV